MRLLLTLILTCTSIATADDLVAYRLRAYGTNNRGESTVAMSTCFPVGQLDGGGTLLVGAAHTVAQSDRAQVSIAGRWYPVRRVTASSTQDLVALEIDQTVEQELALGESQAGLSVNLLGYGSEYNGGKAETLPGRMVTAAQMVGLRGHHAIHGDSGGPVCDLSGRVVGVCSEVQWMPTASRSDYAGQDAKTNLVPVSEVKRFLAQYYQQSCGPSGCTIWMGGGLQGYRPAPAYAAPRPNPVVQPQKPVIDSESILRDEVRKWLAANAAALKGKDGRDGVDGSTTIAPLRVQLRRAGKVIDEESYGPGETLVLDVETLTGGK